MWRYWTIGFLGLWVMLVPYLSVPLLFERVILVVSGLIISIVAFWLLSETLHGGS
jgi:hypothetical protein